MTTTPNLNTPIGHRAEPTACAQLLGHCGDCGLRHNITTDSLAQASPRRPSASALHHEPSALARWLPFLGRLAPLGVRRSSLVKQPIGELSKLRMTGGRSSAQSPDPAFGPFPLRVRRDPGSGVLPRSRSLGPVQIRLGARAARAPQTTSIRTASRISVSITIITRPPTAPRPTPNVQVHPTAPEIAGRWRIPSDSQVRGFSGWRCQRCDRVSARSVA
jgi:hypothetical protein